MIGMTGLAKTKPDGRLVFRQKPALEWVEGFARKKKFSEEQIVSVLKQAEVGVPVVEQIRKFGISEFRWKSK